MKTFFLVVQLITALLLIVLILMQTSKGGLQANMGGDFYRTKRGAEKIVFYLTILTAGIFFLITVINVFFIR